MPKIWDLTQDPKHSLAGMAVVAGGDSPPQPLVLPPRGTSPREEPRKGSPHAASSAGRVQWNCVCRIAPSPLPPLWFAFCFLLSTASENKDIQDRRIVQLRQVRLWL